MFTLTMYNEDTVFYTNTALCSSYSSQKKQLSNTRVYNKVYICEAIYVSGSFKLFIQNLKCICSQTHSLNTLYKHNLIGSKIVI